jgi:hypothetical protein
MSQRMLSRLLEQRDVEEQRIRDCHGQRHWAAWQNDRSGLAWRNGTPRGFLICRDPAA